MGRDMWAKGSSRWGSHYCGLQPFPLLRNARANERLAPLIIALYPKAKQGQVCLK